MFDPQAIYSRRTYDSRKGQVIQKKGSKANKEIDLNSIPRIIEFLRNNGYYISDHVTRPPVYIDRYVDVELTSENYYNYVSRPIDYESVGKQFYLSEITSSSLNDIRGKYTSLLNQIDDIVQAELIFNVKSFNYSFTNAQQGGTNSVNNTSTLRFTAVNSPIQYHPIIKPLGEDQSNVIGIISKFAGGVFAFTDSTGIIYQFSTQVTGSLATYSTNSMETVYAYLAEGIIPQVRFGGIDYDIFDVDRQVE